MASLNELIEIRRRWLESRERVRAAHAARLAEAAERDRAAARQRDRTWRSDGPRHGDVWEIAYDVQQRTLGLRDIATVTVAEALLPFEGWTVRDVMWALERLPDGSEQTWLAGSSSAELRLTRRLAPWKGLDGPHGEYVARVLREKEESAERRALRRTMDEIERRDAVPVPEEVRALREELRTRRRARTVPRTNPVGDLRGERKWINPNVDRP
ncbi:hypothetical protein [Kineococcus rhizosphaerae]|uniref:Uncharacterized protein n=1 Tax=Kineococcus rhizosphaerae TaxID=559628 RepID=A0A2T0R3U5_9ACTN|nr:hypothetical protein [Kineococcus rhizosphaerae]PRY14716.1 hypothetical protein CLV37_106276 [Kineococcus rhizosphaerae]